MTQKNAPRSPRRRLMPVWQMVLYHVLALGIALVLFCLPHHVLPSRERTVDVKRTTTTTPQATAQTGASSDPQTAEQQTTAPQGDPLVPESYSWWDEMFTDQPYAEDNLYVGRNTRVEIRETRGETEQYFVADVYVRNVTHLMGVFAKDQVGKGIRESIASAAERTGSVVMINGDYYGGRSAVVCARNGELYKNREDADRELCILYSDGTMKTFSQGEADVEEEMARGAYHIWNFGPWLINEDGTARTDFPSSYDDISGRHPRTVLGYIEPGHYLLVVIDGRMTNIRGLSLEGLAAFMQSLGCKQAFNLDGGQTSQMMVGTTLINTPYKGGRDCSDYIAIVD